MKTIRAYFPCGYRAALPPDRRRSEWPPTPARLFSALVAALTPLRNAHGEDAYARCRIALQWLEARLPEIHAENPRTENQSDIVGFCPVNEISGIGPKKMLVYSMDRQAKSRVATYSQTNTVYFFWPAVDGPWADLDLLCGYACRMGNGESLVELRVMDGRPPEGLTVLVPMTPAEEEAGEEAERVYGYEPGRLAGLEADYEAGRPARLPLLYPYRPVETTIIHPSQRWGRRFVLTLGKPRGIPLTEAAWVAGCVRQRVLKVAAEMLGDGVPSVLHGHVRTERHVAFVPLPSVFGPHPTGNLAGVVVLFPAETGQADIQVCTHILSRVRDFSYKEADLVLKPGNRENLLSLEVGRWSRPVDEWTTVTPLAIRHPNGPGSPVDRAKFAEEQIRVWCSRAKLPDPVRVVSSMYADLPAIPPAREFKQRSRHSDGSPAPTDWLVHAALRFPVPIKGPLVLGRTANFGAGLMVPASGRVMDQRY